MTETFDAELRRLKERIAEVEAMAAAAQRANLGDALDTHYNRPRLPVDPARARLERAARLFVPDPAHEAAVAARAKDPRAYDREMRRVGAGLLELAVYTYGRDAAIKLGTFVPDAEGDK